MYIAITGLKPKNFFSKLRFWLLAIPSFRAAQKAEGNIFCETKPFNGYQHTLTAWKDSCLLYTSPSPRDAHESRMPSSA